MMECSDRGVGETALKQPDFALLIYMIKIRFLKWKQPAPVPYYHDRFKM